MDVVPSALVKAAAAAIILVGLGVLVGLQMDDTRTNYLEDQLQEANLQTEMFLVTDNYLEESSQNYCAVVETQIPAIARRNTQIGQDLQSFSGQSISERKNYDYLQRKYYVSQLKLYNLLQQYNERCEANATLVFFFFDSSAASQRQGAALTEYRETVDNRTYVFSYNLEAEDSQVLEVLKTDFNVEDGPTLVVNGNRTYRGYVPLQELKTVLSRSG